VRSALLAAALLSSAALSAHELHYELARDAAVVLRLHYANGQAFAYEAYELYRGEESTPYQVGRTDAVGRVAFVPGVTAEWRIKAYSEDGHGIDRHIDVTPAGTGLRGGSLIERYPRAVIGVSVILGLFGLYQLLLSRRKG
jgi:nickel transport protein